jgi:hypothetical protein
MPAFLTKVCHEATKMTAKSAVAGESERGILDSMLSETFAETSFAGAFSKPQ